MNYAAVFLVAIFVFAGLYWAVRGRKFYTGPIVQGYETQGLQEHQSEESREPVVGEKVVE